MLIMKSETQVSNKGEVNNQILSINTLERRWEDNLEINNLNTK